MERKMTCKEVFDTAAVRLAGNPYLPPYLLGMAQAWRMAGKIDDTTYMGMTTAAAALHRAEQEGPR